MEMQKSQEASDGVVSRALNRRQWLARLRREFPIGHRLRQANGSVPVGESVQHFYFLRL